MHGLGPRAFSVPGSNGQTLKAIVESETILKVFLDVRNDSDALYGHFNIRLGCIYNLQLMELATRAPKAAYLSGLAKCIERDAQLSPGELVDWRAVKKAEKRLFAPERGGRYSVLVLSYTFWTWFFFILDHFLQFGIGWHSNLGLKVFIGLHWEKPRGA